MRSIALSALVGASMLVASGASAQYYGYDNSGAYRAGPNVGPYGVYAGGNYGGVPSYNMQLYPGAGAPAAGTVGPGYAPATVFGMYGAYGYAPDTVAEGYCGYMTPTYRANHPGCGYGR